MLLPIQSQQTGTERGILTAVWREDAHQSQVMRDGLRLTARPDMDVSLSVVAKSRQNRSGTRGAKDEQWLCMSLAVTLMASIASSSDTLCTPSPARASCAAARERSMSDVVVEERMDAPVTALTAPRLSVETMSISLQRGMVSRTWDSLLSIHGI